MLSHFMFHFMKWQSPSGAFEKIHSLLMFTAALFTIAKKWKQPKCPSTDERTKKMWSRHTMEYYSATKSRVHLFETPWTVACQALPMGFSKQEYWSGLPCPPAGESSRPRD